MEIYFSGVFKLQIQLYTYELFNCVVHWVYFGSFFMDPFHLAYQFYVFAYRAVNFSVLSPSYKFCYTVFSFWFCSLYFLKNFPWGFSDLVLFRSILFSFQMFGSFSIFSVTDSSLIPLCEKIYLCYIPLNLLRFALWLRMWSISVYVSWALEKNVCSVVECSIDID